MNQIIHDYDRLKNVERIYLLQMIVNYQVCFLLRLLIPGRVCLTKKLPLLLHFHIIVFIFVR